MTTLNLIDTNYRAFIPFHILLDLDLTANALRMYGLIEQMESSRQKVYFTMKYLANQLGIEKRQTQYIVKQLKEKGYIEHFEYNPGKWLWKTKKHCPEEEVEEGCSLSAGGGALAMQGGVQSECTHNIHQSNNQNITTTSGSVASQIDEEVIMSKEKDDLFWKANLGNPMHAKDRKEFLSWCKFFMEYLCKAKDEPGKIRVLLSILKSGGLTKPKGYIDSVDMRPVYVYEKLKIEHVKDKSIGIECLTDLRRFTFA